MTLALAALSPAWAQADTVILLMQSGPEDKRTIKLLGDELTAAGHTPMVVGASLEDSALMLGCPADKGSCVDAVIDTAGASDYDWKYALS